MVDCSLISISRLRGCIVPVTIEAREGPDYSENKDPKKNAGPNKDAYNNKYNNELP